MQKASEGFFLLTGSAAAQPDTGQSGTDRPDTGQSGTGQSGTDQSGTGQSGTDRPDTGQSGTDRPDTGQSVIDPGHRVRHHTFLFLISPTDLSSSSLA